MRAASAGDGRTRKPRAGDEPRHDANVDGASRRSISSTSPDRNP